MAIIMRIAGILVSLFLVASLTFTGCMTFRETDISTTAYFDKKDREVSIHYLSLEDRAVRFIETNASPKAELPLVVFVHGAPGSSKDFQKYLTDSLLRTKAHMVLLDRPGYGYSGYGIAEPSIARQAAAVKAILNYYNTQDAILVGHSYGGSIVGKVAMDAPEKLSAIMLLAPVIDPDSERIFWYANFARWRATRWLLSKALRVAGAEKFAHPDELRKIEDDWDEINIPVVHIHGKKDKHLAPYGNVEFSRNRISTDILNLIVLEKAGHLIPWTDYDVVKSELVKLLKKH